MKLWIVTNLFAPDVLGGAALYSDMAEWFHARGHDVRVTTTFSYYPAWLNNPEDKEITLREELWHNIPLRRIGMYVPAVPSGAKRLLSDASFLWALLRRGKFPNWTPDAIITAEPMLSQCVAQRFLYPLKKIPRLIIVQDFVVDAAIELGLIRNTVIIGAARRLEYWALGAATVLSTISPLMLKKLRLIAPPQIAKHYVPNWIHSAIPRALSIQQQLPSLRATRTLVYAGNLGMKQGLPDFVRLFSSIDHDWTLRIHGDGAAALALRQIVAELGDHRIQIGEILAEDAYLHLLLTATACVVTQKTGTGAIFLPSKVLPCLASGTPILAICDGDSPLAQEVAAGGFGLVLNSSSPSALQAALEQMALPAQASRYGQAALRHATHYTADVVLPKIEALIGLTPA